MKFRYIYIQVNLSISLLTIFHYLGISGVRIFLTKAVVGLIKVVLSYQKDHLEEVR